MRGWRKLVVSGFEFWQPKLPLTWRFGVGCPESILMVVVSGCYKVFKNSVVVCRSFGVVLIEVLARCRAHTCSCCAPLQGSTRGPGQPGVFQEQDGQDLSHDIGYLKHIQGIVLMGSRELWHPPHILQTLRAQE